MSLVPPFRSALRWKRTHAPDALAMILISRVTATNTGAPVQVAQLTDIVVEADQVKLPVANILLLGSTEDLLHYE
jgi:hypothetical protein